jgi:hypothetical protein
MAKLLCPALLSLTLVGGPALAEAKEPPTISLAALAHLGLGTPIGNVGAAAEATLYERLRIEIGAGFKSEGIQLEALASFVHERFAIGAGYSQGAHRWDESFLDCSDTCDAREWDTARWVNFDAAYRLPIGERFHVTPRLNYSLMLNESDHSCPPAEGGCGDEGDGASRIGIGVVLGTEI